MRGGPLEKGDCVWFEPEEGVRFEGIVAGYGDYPNYQVHFLDGPFWRWLHAAPNNEHNLGHDAIGIKGVPRKNLIKRVQKKRDLLFIEGPCDEIGRHFLDTHRERSDKFDRHWLEIEKKVS